MMETSDHKIRIIQFFIASLTGLLIVFFMYISHQKSPMLESFDTAAQQEKVRREEISSILVTNIINELETEHKVKSLTNNELQGFLCALVSKSSGRVQENECIQDYALSLPVLERGETYYYTEGINTPNLGVPARFGSIEKNGIKLVLYSSQTLGSGGFDIVIEKPLIENE